jgi:ATP-binding cassette, subfamily B, bacterial
MSRRFLLQQALVYRGRLLLIGGLSLLSSLSALTIPWLAGQLLGGVVAGDSLQLPQLIILLALALTCLTAFNIAAQIVSAAAAARILTDLRNKTYRQVQSLPASFHDRSRQGDLLALMSWEVQNLSNFLTATLAAAPATLFTAGGAMLLLLLIDPALALLLPLALPLLLILPRLVGRRLRGLGGQSRKAEAMVMNTANTHLEMLPATKAFAVEEQQAATYVRHTERARRLRVRQAMLSAPIGPLTGLLAALGAIAMLVLAGQGVASGERSPAELFAFLLYAALLARPLGAMADFYSQYQIAKGTLARLQAVFRHKPEPGLLAPGQGPLVIDAPASNISMTRARGEIRFEQVEFAYPGRPPVLCGASLAIAPGEIVAIVGENGAGKSTMLKLLLRLYDPQAGRVLLDGQDITAMPVQHLRRQIGQVPQRALLFDGTVRENIAFGTPDADAAMVERAVQLSQAHDFIAALPQGLETLIGDHGVRLSGGQRQRIALARALLADPPILVFDEATSMFDLEAECAFVEACQTALRGRTVIIVTHRPASLALADRIFEVADGVAREVVREPA